MKAIDVITLNNKFNMSNTENINMRDAIVYWKIF